MMLTLYKQNRYMLAFFPLLIIALAACSARAPVSTIRAVTSTEPAPSSTASVTPPLILTLTPTAPLLPTVISTQTPPEFPLSGIEIHAVEGLTLVSEAGAYWVRRNALLWSDVEPEPGLRKWDALKSLEQELISIANQGMQAILIVRSTPPWAQKLPGVYCGPVKAESLTAFASFMRDAVARYSVPPYNVKYWELGNEPDIDPTFVAPDSVFGCWGDQKDTQYGGAYYAEMLKVVYPQVKITDPQAQVLVGGLLMDCDPVNPPETTAGSGKYRDCTPSRFLEGILINGGGDFFDGVSFHAYDYYYSAFGQYGNPNWHSSWDTTGPVSINKGRYLKDLLLTHGYPGKFLMNTENAILCGRDGTESTCQGDDYARTKASYIAQSFTVALAEGMQANVWFSLYGWRGSGLVSSSAQPFPAYQAYQFNANSLRLAVPGGGLTDYPGVRGYRFMRGPKTVWVLWSLDGSPHTIVFPSLPDAIYDIVGNPQSTAQEFTVTLSPVYVEWSQSP